MKKLLLAAVMAFGMLSASAQAKIGYINTDELMAMTTVDDTDGMMAMMWVVRRQSWVKQQLHNVILNFSLEIEETYPGFLRSFLSCL